MRPLSAAPGNKSGAGPLSFRGFQGANSGPESFRAFGTKDESKTTATDGATEAKKVPGLNLGGASSPEPMPHLDLATPLSSRRGETGTTLDLGAMPKDDDAAYEEWFNPPGRHSLSYLDLATVGDGQQDFFGQGFGDANDRFF